MREVCDALDVLEGSLRLWMRQFPSGKFLPVRVKAALDRDAGEAREIGPGTISLTTPNGLRFDALDVGRPPGAAPMIGLGKSSRIFVSTKPADMREGLPERSQRW